MAAKGSKADDKVIEVMEVKEGIAVFAIIGQSPLILNRLSQKAMRTLVLGGTRKTRADKASTLKHDPLAEFQASPHRIRDESAPTLLAVRAEAFKGALRTAALDMSGASKSEIGRLTYVPGEYVGVYGEPKLLMSPVRSSDIARTPDIRTRCIVAEWAAVVEIRYREPNLRAQVVANLLTAAGMNVGVGDWRPEKGAGAYGRFRPTSMDDADFVRIRKIGRAEQLLAMERAEPYDDETDELLTWCHEETARRGFTTRPAPLNGDRVEAALGAGHE